MDTIEHILTPWSASWWGWTMFILFLCGVVSEFMQPGIISQAHSSLLSQNDRTYKAAPSNLYGQILITLFRLGTIAMGAGLCVYPGGEFSFAAYAAVLGVTFGLVLLKMAGNGLLDYTFMLSRRFAPVYEQYGDTTTLAACLLYPALLVTMYIGSLDAVRWVCAGVAALFLMIWTYRAARTFVSSPAAVLYIALYIGTMEILPTGGLLYLSSIMIKIL